MTEEEKGQELARRIDAARTREEIEAILCAYWPASTACRGKS